VTLDQAERAQVRTLYQTDLAYLDEQLDRLLTGWEEAGIMEHSLVLVLADHGEAFWQPTADGSEEVEHGGSFREELIRVPLLVWVPGRTGQERSEAVDLTAVKPAVLSWVDGLGLGPLDSEADMHTPLGSLLFADGVEGCTDGRSKLVRHAAFPGRPGAASMEFYDLEADPQELRPRSGGAPSEWIDCIEEARQTVGQGVSGDIGALRVLGYVD
jgi:arylsulfatase A-like enzyme